jgi:quinohemoprotein ethanol dehydrogenase
MKRTIPAAVLGLTLPLLACLPAAHAASALPVQTSAAADWTSHNGGTDETAYSQLNQITTGNIGKLGLAWSMVLPGESTLEATPLAVNGVLYFTGTQGKVYAVDGASGKTLWTYDPLIWKVAPDAMRYTFGVNRGVAYDAGKIFSASVDGRLFALDAKTGALLWTAHSIAPGSYQTVTGAPRVFNGKVIIGQGGADFGARGYVTAYDENTGKQLWRFYVVPGSPQQNAGDPAMLAAAKSWGATFYKVGGGGGGPWDSLTFDSELNRIYIGTANAGPYDPESRDAAGGDNLYTASIVALDADTGKYVWHYQEVPRDEWDFDATQQMTLATIPIDGKPRKVLMQAPKNGFFYVLDRETGKLISAQKLGKVTWADSIDLKTGRPIEAPHDRYDAGGRVEIWPAPMGAHSWMSMSYDPQTGLVYIPYMQLGVSLAKGVPQSAGFQVGTINILGVAAQPLDNKGALLAWNPATQKVVWRAQHDAIWNGGALSTAGGLVFQGTALGNFSAYDAQNGKQLWNVMAGGGVIAAPMSFEAGGKQYVALLVGYGGSTAAWGARMNVGWKWGQPRYLLVFALDGKAPLPPTPTRDTTIHPVDDPGVKLNPVDVATGHALFIQCAACHGVNLVSTGSPAPDLRESQIALNPATFYAVLNKGLLLPAGMPRFDNMTHEQVMQIWAYIRQGARDALAKQ